VRERAHAFQPPADGAARRRRSQRRTRRRPQSGSKAAGRAVTVDWSCAGLTRASIKERTVYSMRWIAGSIQVKPGNDEEQVEVNNGW
jgi:hypothetical protein